MLDADLPAEFGGIGLAGLGRLGRLGQRGNAGPQARAQSQGAALPEELPALHPTA